MHKKHALKASEIMPVSRSKIPEEWAQKARCPVCRTAPMQLVRSPKAKDQLACKRCGTAFEIEQGGTRLFFIQVPSLLSHLRGQWMTIAEIQSHVRRLAQERLSPHSVESADSSSPVSAVQPFTGNKSELLPQESEALKRAKKLYELGNTPEQIKIALERSENLLPNDIQRAVEEIQKIDEQKRASQKRRLIIGIGIALLVLACVVCAAITINAFLSSLTTLFQTSARESTVCWPLTNLQTYCRFSAFILLHKSSVSTA